MSEAATEPRLLGAQDDELKLVLKAVGDLTKLVSDASDGMGLKEVGDVIVLVKDSLGALRNKGLIIPQFESLDDAARQDLATYILANVSYPADVTVQDYLQKLLNAAIALSALFN